MFDREMRRIAEVVYARCMDTKHCTHCGSAIAKKVHPSTVHPFCDARCYGMWQRGRTRGPIKAKRPCATDGCDAAAKAKGFCRRHYLALAYTPPKKPTAHTRRPPKKCLHCGDTFHAEYDAAKYCSSACSGAHRKKPFIIKKGYRKILIPAHPRADAKGYVFEHLVIAEATIGRPLRNGEEVHHKDFNRQNNAPDNLQVCSSHEEHMRFHRAT